MNVEVVKTAGRGARSGSKVYRQDQKGSTKRNRFLSAWPALVFFSWICPKGVDKLSGPMVDFFTMGEQSPHIVYYFMPSGIKKCIGVVHYFISGPIKKCTMVIYFFMPGAIKDLIKNLRPFSGT